VKLRHSLWETMDSVGFAAYRRWWDNWSARTQRDLSPLGPRRRDASLAAAFHNLQQWLREQRS